MNKSNKVISILLALLVVLSGANLFVGLSNTYRISQLENAPAVIIEEYPEVTENLSTSETTEDATLNSTTTEKVTETTAESTANLTVSNTTVKESTSPVTDKEDEKDTTSTTVKETEESNSDFCFVTASGTKYHKDGCSYLKKSKTKMTVDEAKLSGYSPCSRCY